jgi:hypothetical protein
MRMSLGRDPSRGRGTPHGPATDEPFTGVLSAEGQVEVSPAVQRIELTRLTLRDVKADFVHDPSRSREKAF